MSKKKIILNTSGEVADEKSPKIPDVSIMEYGFTIFYFKYLTIYFFIFIFKDPGPFGYRRFGYNRMVPKSGPFVHK